MRVFQCQNCRQRRTSRTCAASGAGPRWASFRTGGNFMPSAPSRTPARSAGRPSRPRSGPLSVRAPATSGGKAAIRARCGLGVSKRVTASRPYRSHFKHRRRGQLRPCLVTRPASAGLDGPSTLPQAHVLPDVARRPGLPSPSRAQHTKPNQEVSQRRRSRPMWNHSDAQVSASRRHEHLVSTRRDGRACTPRPGDPAERGRPVQALSTRRGAELQPRRSSTLV